DVRGPAGDAAPPPARAGERAGRERGPGAGPRAGPRRHALSAGGAPVTASRVRVGVDVGGTFTKAVAFDLDANDVVARAVVPTSPERGQGVGAGVLDGVRAVVDTVGAESVALVTHSTTQAVNALLEGDVGVVGVIGVGRVPDLRKVDKRTRLTSVELAPG